ncbi:hypothetical protein STEG23_023904, partial [Scotinomys teguina]
MALSSSLELDVTMAPVAVQVTQIRRIGKKNVLLSVFIHKNLEILPEIQRDSSALFLSLKIRAEFELMGFSEYKI